ncbi:MAG: phage major capsid protein [Clostridiaceae bacterium]|nr:phage major capsid protein [Clostridiaceae bacterium]
MKSIVEIRKEIKTRTDKMAEIFGGAELENRKLNADEAKEFDKLRGEVDGLKADLEHEERRLALGKPDAKPVTGARDGAEERGRALKEDRSVLLDATGVLLPGYQANNIIPTFNEVSTLIDRVQVKMFNGGESFQQPYLAGYGVAGYATEGGNPNTAEPTFGSVTIGKTKIAAYAENSKELVKLPAANYEAEIVRGITVAMRKYITGQILFGDGETGHFTGLFDNGATAIDAATDIDIADITEDTLDEIIFSFGGDEDVEDVAVLILNKIDVKAFAMLRDTLGKKVYEVRARGNAGTINGVPYIINSNCEAIKDPATTSGQYAMAYGPLSNYLMTIFSDMEIARSTDFLFKTGMIAHRGEIYAGGNVVAKNGFLRVKRT